MKCAFSASKKRVFPSWIQVLIEHVNASGLGLTIGGVARKQRSNIPKIWNKSRTMLSTMFQADTNVTTCHHHKSEGNFYGCGQSAICETTKVMPTLFHNCIRNVTFRKARMFHTFKGPIQGRTPLPRIWNHDFITSWLPVIGGEESIWNRKIHQNPRRGWCGRMLVVWPVFFCCMFFVAPSGAPVHSKNP